MWLDLLKCVLLRYFYWVVFLFIHFITFALTHNALQLHLFFSCFSFFSTVFFDGLQRLFAWFFSISALGEYNHCRPYQYDMLRVFKSCTLEIKRNSGFKREHVESCSLTTKNIITPLTQCIWLPNLVGWWLRLRGFYSWRNWLRGLVRSRDLLELFYLRYRSASGHQTYENGDLPRGTSTQRASWPFSHVVFVRSYDKVKRLYLH